MESLFLIPEYVTYITEFIDDLVYFKDRIDRLQLTKFNFTVKLVWLKTMNDVLFAVTTCISKLYVYAFSSYELKT